ncbi:MAG: gliding motility-associated C-terminal domain-containing protein [Bacteroidales bacterium]
MIKRRVNTVIMIQASRLKRVIISLFCITLFLLTQVSVGQVINNNGAVISVSSGTYVNSKDANNTAGTLSNNGNLTLTGNFTSTATTNGDGIYRIGGNWTNGGVFNAGISTVYFNGTANQSLSNPAGETFFNLYLSNSGTAGSNFLGLNNNVTVQGTLTMSAGNINSGTSRIYLSNPLISALSYSSTTGSRIVGKFERKLSQAGTYLFPLGTVAHYNPANFTNNTVPVTGNILSEFLNPGFIDSLGLPLYDAPDEVARVYQDGYWSMTSTGFSISNFNINLDGSGFTSYPPHYITDITRIIKRTTGGNWTLDGTHNAAAGTIAYRNNLTGNISGSGTQFALALSRPKILKHPRDTIVCESKPYATSYAEFEIQASSTRNLTYTWYKEPSTLLTGSHYNTTGPGVLIINNVALADSGRYYCIVTDDYGTSTRTNSAVLKVNKRPVVTMTPSQQDHTCSNVAFTNIVMGESNGVAGTSFIWYRSNPAGIITAIPMTGSIPAVGGFISGTITNTTDAPIKVKFYITPVGPLPTSCAGHVDSTYVIVNPTPRVVPINTKPQICYGGTTDITLTSPSIMTMGQIKFDYTVSVTGGPGVVVGPTAPGSNLTPGQKIQLQYQDNSDTIQSVFYTITPKVVGLGCPNGVNQVPEVKIHAKPLQGNTIVQPLKCSGGSDAILRADLSKGAGPYYVHWTGPFGLSRFTQVISGGIYAGTYKDTVMDNLGCKNSSLLSIDGSYTSSLVLVNTPVSCYGGSDGIIQVKVDESTGIPPFSYWILKDDVDTVANGTLNTTGIFNYHGGLSAGSYTVHMKDSQDCWEQYPQSVELPQPDLIKVTFERSSFAGGYNVSCKGYWDGYAMVKTISGGNGGYTYHWYTNNGNIHYGPVNTNRIDSLAAGRYYLEVRDSKNCYMLDSIDIVEPAGMVLSGSQVSVSRDGVYNISCNGFSDGFIKIDVSGGSGSYLFNWVDSTGTYSAGTKDISGLRAGTYIATVTDVSNSKCYLSPKPRFRLTQPSPLGVSALKSTAPDLTNNINCFGGTGSVNLTVTGGSVGNYRFNWTTSNGSGIVQGLEDQNALTAGNYHVVLTDTNQCVIPTDVVLIQPQKLQTSMAPVNLTCTAQGSVDLSVSGGAAPYGFSWSNGSTTEDISSLAAGKYIVTVTDINGCTKADSATVSLPPPVTYDTTFSWYNGYNISCANGSNGWIKVNVTSGIGPYTYAWTSPYGSFSTGDISDLRQGQYDLIITDNSTNCTATGSFILTEPGKLGMNLTLSQSKDGFYNIDCAGAPTGSIEVMPVNNAGPVHVLWSDGDTSRVRSGLYPDRNYRVIILDQNNCNTDSIVSLTAPDSIKISFDVTQAWCPDSPDGEIRSTVTGGIPIGSGYIYNWSDGSSGQVVSNILKGWYWLTVTDANDCSVKDSVNMEPQKETCLIVHNIFSPNGDNINDRWEIGMTNLYPEMEVRVYNRWGQQVWKSARGYADPWDGRSNGAVLPIDSYHYVIDLHNGSKPILGNVTIVK